ncbi:hypothetical protein A5646_03580 [Mycobacterium sp. 1245499.0]|uniref:hypothetical protein n=1 Tax=Mycobacterium sp. 1245499.0 TaxID=1834074 RepID=UPI0007FD4C35|nr:hypothetical protein [Mycobacterium sp. 1245499.0]OBK92395.1 hypothetical protein A5646_03580 [Mycobacterium sp. 1245499.0]
MSTDAPEQITDAERVIVLALCKGFTSDPVGPFTWLCRLAWFTLTSGQDFDADAAIAGHAAWLNDPKNATDRANIVSCIDYMRPIAAKARL